MQLSRVKLANEIADVRDRGVKNNILELMLFSCHAYSVHRDRKCLLSRWIFLKHLNQMVAEDKDESVIVK